MLIRNLCTVNYPSTCFKSTRQPIKKTDAMWTEKYRLLHYMYYLAVNLQWITHTFSLAQL